MSIKLFYKSISYIFALLFVSLNVFANNALDNINNILQVRSQSQASIISTNIAPTDNSINKSVYNLNSDYTFVLFYRLSCPHCRRFDPILKDFSVTTGIKVKAFSLDGGFLPSFPDSSNVNKETIEQYFGKGADVAVPALFIMNTQTLHVFPVASGELSYTELVLRMNDLTPKILEVEGGIHA